MIPERFGKYVLLERLAFGGMAEIFAASLKGAEGFEKRLVIKRILPQFSSDPSFVKMFIDEALIAANLSHPNIVQVYDFGEVYGRYYLAMEFVNGVDLRRLLSHARKSGWVLGIAEVAAIGEMVARGLSHAHGALDAQGQPLGLVHRDISPHNIMVSCAGDAKVMDFGIAKAGARATRTQTGIIKGKVAYMAPEQASALEIDKRVDQFALGLVLWELLAGERMFQGDSDVVLLRKVVEAEIRPLTAYRPDVVPALEAIILRALARDPEHRYSDLADLEEALQRFRFSLGPDGVVNLGTRVRMEMAASTPKQGTLSLPEAAEGEPVKDRMAAHEISEPAVPTPLSPTASMAATSPRGDVRAEFLRDAMPSEFRSAGRRWWLPLGLTAGALVALGWGGRLFLLSMTSSSTVVEPIKVPSASMEPPRTSLMLESTPPGAKVSVNGADTGLRTPVTLPGQPRGRRKVSLMLPGHVPHEQDVFLERESQVIRVMLKPAVRSEPKAPAAQVAPLVKPASRRTSKASTSRPQRRGKASRSRIAPQKETPAPAPKAWISVRAQGGWAEVYAGDQRLGTTPLHRVEVTAGPLVLHFVNRDADIDKKVEVTVAPDAHLKKTVTLP